MRNAFAVRKAAQTPLKISISPASPASSSSSAEIEILTTPPHSRKRKQETDKDESQRKRQKKIKENKKNKLRYYDPQEESDVLTDSVLAVFENTTREHSPNRPFGDVSNTEETRSPSILAPLLTSVLSTFEPSTGLNLFILSVEERRQLKTLGLPDKRTTAIVLQARETLFFLETVNLTLLQGEVTLFGTTLYPSTTQHSIFAARSYPVATITAGDNSSSRPLLSGATWLPKNLGGNVTPDRAILLLQDLDCGIEGLGRVCKTLANVFETDSDYQGVDFGLAQFRSIRQGSVHLSPYARRLSWDTTTTELCNFYSVSQGTLCVICRLIGREPGSSRWRNEIQAK